MKAIIIYESLHGSTEKCALYLEELLQTDVDVKRLRDNNEIRLDDYEMVIIGGSIHHGVIQTRIEDFIKKNHHKLLAKQLGLYLCCMEEGETAKQQFERAFQTELRKRAIVTGLFGGEFNLKKMSFFEKKFTRKLTGISSSVSKINVEEIKIFAGKINGIMNYEL
jgi:menaquinone-dependent protoporphyrinogen oxidase